MSYQVSEGNVISCSVSTHTSGLTIGMYWAESSVNTTLSGNTIISAIGAGTLTLGFVTGRDIGMYEMPVNLSGAVTANE